MKVSLSWLNEYVKIDLPLGTLVDALTMAGLEVEAVTDRYGFLETVRVGRVLDVAPHPNADRLKCCQVDIGDRVCRVVCGAPNVQTGQAVPLALPGTVFPDGTTLGKAAIRGVDSEGMICSAHELRLGSDPAGIMVLGGDLKPGLGLAGALGLSDHTLEIGLTPNRPDCLSIIGVAREIAAIQKTTLTCPDFSLEDTGNRISDRTSVTIAAPDHCPRYAARMITGLTVAPSPFWMQDRLRSVGLRPINNIVDITNFVMMETGQPLHAFDFDQLAGGRIVVRTAAQGERFTTLDGKERRLDDDTLMICDGEKPVAIGGVMGGLNSEIEAGTTTVLLESAYFSPTSIRKSAKALGLSTDASHRFERGVNPQGTLDALNRAARFMAELGGGTVVSGTIDVHPKPVPVPTVSLSVAATNRLLGTRLNRDQIREILESIAFSVAPAGADSLAVSPPPYRVDVSRPEDLMEEVARLWGYNQIPTSFPVMPAEARPASKRRTLREALRHLMTGFGYTEAINYSFINSRACDNLRLSADDPRRNTIGILNPISEDQTVMRTAMLPGLFDTMNRNLAHQQKTLLVYEIGKIYLADGGDTPARECEMLAGLWTGARVETAWYGREEPCDFYDIKGSVEGLLAGLGIPGAEFTATPADACRYTRPGYSAALTVGDVQVGHVGEVHPDVRDNFDLKQTAFVFEIDVDRLLQLVPDMRQSKPIPRYPSVSRDVTLILDSQIEAGAVLKHVESQGEPLVEGVMLFDLYLGEPIPTGKKSISFRITYRSPEKTLEDDQVTALHETVTRRLINAFDAGLPA